MRQAAAVSMVSRPMRRAIRGCSQAGLGKRIARAAAEKSVRTSTPISASCVEVLACPESSKASQVPGQPLPREPRSGYGSFSAIHGDPAGAVAADDFVRRMRVGLEFHVEVACCCTAAGMQARNCGQIIGFTARKSPGGAFEPDRPEIQAKARQRSATTSVAPSWTRPGRWRKRATRSFKLNIGNMAPFGFDAPEEIQQDMIRNLP